MCMHIYVCLTAPLSIDKHLGCIHVLAVVNNAAVNMGCRYLFELVLTFPFDMYQEVELLDPMVVLFFML